MNRAEETYESRQPRSSWSVGRLLAVGVALLWVVTPLLLGGLITLAVRAHNGGGIGLGVGAVLVVGGLVAVLALLGGFAALVAALVGWARTRHGGILHTERSQERVDEDPEDAPSRV